MSIILDLVSYTAFAAAAVLIALFTFRFALRLPELPPIRFWLRQMAVLFGTVMLLILIGVLVSRHV
ncbi:MAG TPA: hypothetical protein VEB03_00015 [Candidatus Nanoarchaeia archaeon]|nr:hypothetical protein [Candidatus Nanoarchaeia archaeon]